VPLTPLQEQVARTIATLPEAEGFALAGGGAMIVLGIADRPTRDLDYFGTAPDAVDRLRPPLERALEEQGLLVEVRRAVPGFVEYQIADARDGTALDVSWDSRLQPAQQTELGAVLARDDLAADKMLALFGRSEARDFVDVYRLRAHYSRDNLCRLAAAKDAGFDPRMFAGAVAGLDRHLRADLPIDDAAYTALREEFSDWLGALLSSPAVDLDVEHEGPGLDL
jgi:hypothetical protein